jgi:ubiquinone/menaquinone biosynthesis C-methylase UbiE
LLVKGYQEVPTRKLGEELKELFTEGQLFRLYENKLKNAKLAQDLRSVDLQSLPYPDESFDLLLSTCVLIHCEKPDLAIDSILRVTKKGSRSVIYVPNEGSPILVLAQKLFTRPKQRRAGFDGEIIHYSEHRFQYKYLLSLLKKKNVKFSTRYFPFVFLPWWFNLWTIVTVQKD